MGERPNPNESLRALETAIVGAWIACLVMFWVAASSHRLYAANALELDQHLRWRLTWAEGGLGGFLVLLLLRRGEHGVRLFLPFLALALGLASALWLAPDAALLEASLGDLSGGPRSERAGRLDGLHLALGACDGARVLSLFALLVLELKPGRSPRR